MWYSNDMFYYMLKADFVTLVSLKISSGEYRGTLEITRLETKITVFFCFSFC